MLGREAVRFWALPVPLTTIRSTVNGSYALKEVNAEVDADTTKPEDWTPRRAVHVASRDHWYTVS